MGVGRERSPDHVRIVQHHSHATQKRHLTHDTMVQLKFGLATTADDLIKWLTGQFQQFSSDQSTRAAHNTETDEITLDFDVIKRRSVRRTKRSETSVEHGSTRSMPDLLRTLWSEDDDILGFSLPFILSFIDY